MPQMIDLTQPYGGKGKYGAAFQGIADILKSIGNIERLRQDRALNGKIISVVAMGGGSQEIARAVTEAQPQYSSGSVGFLQKLANEFAPPSMVESQIGQMGIAKAFEGPNIGAIPYAATQMTPEQRQRWLDNYGKGITIQTGQRLLPEEDRIARAKLEQDKIMGRTGPGFSPSDKKAIGEEMDTALDNAKRWWPYQVGRADYTGDALFREWEKLIAKNTFENDNQRENTLAAWKQKVNNRGKDWFRDNEVDWDPMDPKWRKAIGLPVISGAPTQSTGGGATISTGTQKPAGQGFSQTEQIAFLSKIYETAKKNGISRSKLYEEARKLESVEMSEEERMIAFDKMARGTTAEEIIAKRPKSRASLLAEYKRLGGSTSAEARKFAEDNGLLE